MEFGPRALCNTSTLALPTAENVDIINQLNERNTVMPFAPVILEENLSMFEDSERIIGSLQYMIMTLDYKFDPSPELMGVMHKYPMMHTYSGRPQVIPMSSTKPIRDILIGLKTYTQALINTSLNVHGRPIVYSLADAIDDFEFNLKVAKEKGLKAPILVVGDF
jgi:carbamoyltransferase